MRDLPAPPGFRAWKLALWNEIANVTGDPENGFKWIQEVEKTGMTFETLGHSGMFPTVDAKLAAALSVAVHGEFARQIHILQEKWGNKGMLLKGRQILWHVHRHYKASEVDGQLLEYDDLLAVRLHQDDLRRFLNDWEMTMSGMKRVPDDDLLETLFRRELKKFSGFRENMAHYERLQVGDPDRSYTYLYALARRHIENRRREAVREALTKTLGTPAYPAASSAGGDSSRENPQRQVGECQSWIMYGKCIHGKDCPLAHDRDRRGRSPTTKPRYKSLSRSPSPRSRNSIRSERGRSPRKPERKSITPPPRPYQSSSPSNRIRRPSPSPRGDRKIYTLQERKGNGLCVLFQKGNSRF